MIILHDQLIIKFYDYLITNYIYDISIQIDTNTIIN
jgi:hypothetical protein